MELVRGWQLRDDVRRLLATQMVSELGHSYPEWTVDEAFAEIGNVDGLPLTVCHLDVEGNALAAASLLDSDEVDGMDGVGPWLANVLVAAAHRGQGHGRAIVRATLELAAGMGFDTLHLVTDTAAGWYLAMGWRDQGDVLVHAHRMRYLLSPSSAELPLQAP